MSTSRPSLAKHFEELVCRAARNLSKDMTRAIEKAAEEEPDTTAKEVLEAILEKAHQAKVKGRGLTSDTGLLTFFVQVGCDFPGIGNLAGAFQDAVAQATKHEPLAPHTTATLGSEPHRDNCGRGLPIVHYELVPGSEDCKVTVFLKGAASEMLSTLWILPPATSLPEIGDRLASLIAEAGGRPCPPLVVGVGMGGTPERATMLSRRALLRSVGEPASEPRLQDAEKAWRIAMNRTGIGPMGLGGDHTVLAVHAESVDRHVAFLPVAVSVACWSDRRAALTIDRNGEIHW